MSCKRGFIFFSSLQMSLMETGKLPKSNCCPGIGKDFLGKLQAPSCKPCSSKDHGDIGERLKKGSSGCFPGPWLSIQTFPPNKHHSWALCKQWAAPGVVSTPRSRHTPHPSRGNTFSNHKKLSLPRNTRVSSAPFHQTNLSAETQGLLFVHMKGAPTRVKEIVKD